jgi:hypothetical protein
MNIKLNNVLNDILRDKKEDPDLSNLYNAFKEAASDNRGKKITDLITLAEQKALNRLDMKGFKRMFKNDIAKSFLIKVLSDFEDISDQEEMYVYAAALIYRIAIKQTEARILAHIMSTHLKDHVFRFSCDDEKTSKELSKTLMDKIYDMILKSPLDYYSTYNEIVKYSNDQIETIIDEVKSAFPFCKVEYGQSLKATIHSVTPGPTNVGTSYKVRL